MRHRTNPSKAETPSTNRRARVATVSIGLTLIVVSVAVFAVTETTQRVAGWSQELHRLSEIQRLVEGQRSAVGLATHFSALTARLPDWDLSAELDQTLTGIEQTARQLETLEARRVDEVDVFLGTTSEIATLLRAGEPEPAQALAEGELNLRFSQAQQRLVDLRQAQLDQITGMDEAGARFGDVARVTVIVLVPLALVLVYREVVERQLRQRQLEMQLEAEQELAAARDEFVANASHELRTPLTGILGLSEILVDDDRIPQDAREMLGMVTTEAADLARMVEDLLTTARLSAGQLRFEPRRVGTVEEAEVITRPFLQAGKELTIDVEDAAVYVDRLRQRQVLRNLISNAVKYGGDRIVLVGRPQGVTYQWAVVDDGPGVPPELERRLFQRYIHTLTFQQAVAGGVGLGLSIVKSLAEGMGGSVGYARVDGLTKFLVKVPLADGSSGDRPSIRAAGGVR